MASLIVARIGGRGYTQEELDELSVEELQGLRRQAIEESHTPDLDEGMARFRKDPTMGIESGPLAQARILADPQAREVQWRNFDAARAASDVLPLVEPLFTSAFDNALSWAKAGAAAKDTEGPSQAATRRMNLIGALGRFAKGGFDTALSAVHPGYLGKPISQDQVAFTEGVSEEASRLTDAEKLLSEPDRSLATASGLVPVPAGPGLARQVARAAQMGDPLVAAARAASAAGKVAQAKVLPGARKIGEVIIGFAGGKGRPAAEAVSRGAEEGLSGDIKDFLSKRETEETLGRSAVGPFKEKAGELGDAIEEVVEGGGDINVSDLKAALVGDIAREGEGGLLHNMGIKIQSAGEQARGLILPSASFKGTTRFDLVPPPDFGLRGGPILEAQVKRLLEGPDVISVKELNDIKKALFDAKAPNSGVKNAFRQVYKAVRKKLSEVEGFDEASDAYKAFKGEEKDIARRLEIKGKNPFTEEDVDPFQRGKQLVRGFDEGEGIDVRMGAFEDLERTVPGATTKAAAQRMSALMPSELAGKSAGLDQLRTVLAPAALFGGASVGGLVGAIASLPIIGFVYSPNLGARNLAFFGRRQRQLDNLRRMMGSFLQEADKRGINLSRTTTIGEVLGRMPDFRADMEGTFTIEGLEEERPQVKDKSLLQQIGSASLAPGQTAQVRPRKLNEPGLSLGDPFAPSR